MSKVTFELNRAGVAELLKGEPMQQALMACAQTAQAAAGSEYEVWHAPTRVVVRAKSAAGERDNLKNNTLLKAVGCG